MSNQPAPDRVRVSGPLARFADGFRAHLAEQGYSLWGAQEQLYLLAHVSRWMRAERVELGSLTPARVERYIVWRRRQGYLSSLSPKSLRRRVPAWARRPAARRRRRVADGAVG